MEDTLEEYILDPLIEDRIQEALQELVIEDIRSKYPSDKYDVYPGVLSCTIIRKFGYRLTFNISYSDYKF